MATEQNINKISCLKEGQLWMNLVDLLDAEDDQSEEELDDLNEESTETMRLRREDMPLFGICPSRDQVFFVVCEHCKGVYKPQALVHHIERRHSNHQLSTSKTTHSNLSSKLKGKNDLNKSKNELNGGDAKIFNCLDNSSSDNVKTVSVTSSPTETQSSDIVLTPVATVTTSPIKPLEPTGPGPGPVSGVSNDVISNCENSEQVILPKTAKKKTKKGLPSTRKLLPCKDREYDANKHCGVWLPEMDKPCTRSLTCKTHSLTLRRAVQGRMKNFDELLAEHRAEKEEAMRALGIEVKPTKKDLMKQQRQQQQLLKQQKLDSNQTRLGDSTLKQLKCDSDKKLTELTSNSNINLLSVATTSLTSPPHQTMVGSAANQYSQPSDSIFINHHPQPAAVCNYNIRRVLPCVRFFNRQWDLTTSVLMSAFCKPLADKSTGETLTNLNSTNSLSSTNTTKSPIRHNQFPALKKLRIELTPLELQIQSQSDPYNFPDATSTGLNNSYTFIKPKTTKSTPQNYSMSTTLNRKRKSDTNLKVNDDHSSLLNNGQLNQQQSHKKSNVNSKINNKKVINSNLLSVSLSPELITADLNQDQNNSTSTSLDLLTNCNETTSDSGSILLNGSLLNNSYNNHLSLGKSKLINKSTTSTTNTFHKSLCINKGSTSTMSSATSLSKGTTIHKLPLTIPSQSQHQTHQTVVIKSQQSPSQNLLSTTIPSKFLKTKSDDFPT